MGNQGDRQVTRFMEPGKRHSQIRLDAPGLCPRCLELELTGREGGSRTELVAEIVDGAKTGKWVCPYGGRSYYQQGARYFPT
jgi:hypothetical protein